MGITSTYMSPTDAGWNNAYCIAIELIPLRMQRISPVIYTLCVYNWAGSQLLQYQQDIAGQSFFKNARKGFGIDSFVPGVITEGHDESTGQSMAVGAGLQNLTLNDLQRIKDPYGRQALAYLQDLGPLWGMS